ncbi:hypothetical protein [Rhodococcus phenolicus]|uniref:hypothetical protein n=1 Tax=Rhodococcus phenolicus TaxID=263849 RepID=UPI00082D5CF7|nr:hypothetical protein [Rhodococcus phenolicus]
MSDRDDLTTDLSDAIFDIGLIAAEDAADYLLSQGWRKVGADAETRTEWGVRRPTQHFGIKVDKARDEEHAREWVAVLHDVEHVLNANPNAEVVCRTVTETAWTTPEEPR